MEAKEKERLEKLKRQQAELQDGVTAEQKKEKAKGAEKEPEVEGKWKMHQVNALPDEVDDVIKTLSECDFTIQDLDVLIELSQQLKKKRT